MSKINSRGIFIFGILFLCLEIFKQSYLYLIVYNGEYNVWYFPFQLCSLPIYICLIFGLVYWKQHGTYGKIGVGGKALMTFLQDFCLLGGIMSLIVRDGFIFPGHILLTAHGYIWHVALIILSIYIYVNNLSDNSRRGFIYALVILAVMIGVAFGLNIRLQAYGDADMFYISPYHISTQPVFSDIDLKVGRPLGIIIYLLAIVLGGFICHMIYCFIDKVRGV